MYMRFFYSKVSNLELTCYEDACYLLDPHNCRSQKNHLFTYGSTTTSWRPVK